jgi:hypothetical protein
MSGLAWALVGFLLGVPVGMLFLVCFMALRSWRARPAEARAGSAGTRRG